MPILVATASRIPQKDFAKKLRSNQTSAEKILWAKLRAKRFHGLKFRRQVPIGPFIVDFLCFEKKVIIEVDGSTHFLQGAKEYDEKREAYLRAQGFTVLRCSHRETIENLDEILTKIGRALGCYTD